MRASNVWRSFQFAFAGLWYVIRTQRNAQIHSAITLLVIALGLYLRLSFTHWAILALTIGVVISAEMMNTAIEAIVDLVSPEFNALAKVAKDAAAGGVLFLAIMAIIVGLLILGPPLWLAIFG